MTLSDQQRAALLQAQTMPSAELAALAELLALIDVLMDLGLIDASRDAATQQWLLLSEIERKALDAFVEAIDRGNALVADHFKRRAGT